MAEKSITDIWTAEPEQEPVTDEVANPSSPNPKPDQSRVPGAKAADSITDIWTREPESETAAAAPKAPGELPAGPLPPRPQEEGDEAHPLFGEEPGAPRAGMGAPKPPASGVMAAGPGSLASGEENDAFWRHVITEVPIVGGKLQKVGEDIAASRRQSLTGMPRSGAEAELEAERKATDKAHPNWAAGGGVVGGVGPLAVLGGEVPALFGLASKVGYKLPALIGAASNAVISGLDDWMRTGKVDPVKTGLSAVAGAGGSALATSLNRLFTSVLKPGIQELARKAIVDHKIKLGAGNLSDNPMWGKVEGELLAGGEKILPLVGRAKAAEARAIDGWHKAITRAIGSDAPRLTARVLEDTAKRIGDRVRELSRLPPGTRWASDEMAMLAERMKDVRILKNVMKVDRYGRFKPEDFHRVIREALDAPGAPYASSSLSDLADIAGIFLKTTSRPKFDLGVALRLLKQGIATGVPAAAHHVYTHGLMSIPSLMTGAVGAVTAGAKVGVNLLGTQVAGAVARSPRVANVLVGNSMPYAPAVIRHGLPIVRPLIPGLVQRNMPEGRPLIHKLMTGE